MTAQRTRLIIGGAVLLVLASAFLLLRDSVKLPRESGTTFTSRVVPTNAPPPTPPMAIPPSTSDQVKISGYCVDAEGLRLSHATVFILPHGTLSEREDVLRALGLVATTDEEGLFSLGIGAAQSPCRVVARYPGLIPAELSLPAGTTSNDSVVLTLATGAGEIVGTVLSLDNQPLEGVRIVARGRNADGETVEPNRLVSAGIEVADAVTDTAGQFTVTGLRAHTYLLQAEGPGLRMVEPERFDGAVVAKPGDRVQFTMESAAIVHLSVVNAKTHEPILRPMAEIDRVSAVSAGFVPYVTLARQRRHRPFLLSQHELCMVGFSDRDVPKPDGSDGRVLIHGACQTWPISESATLRIQVVAAGYSPRTLDVPLHPLVQRQMPAPARIELTPIGDLWRRRDVVFTVLGGDGHPIGGHDIHLKFRRRVDAGSVVSDYRSAPGGIAADKDPKSAKAEAIRLSEHGAMGEPVWIWVSTDSSGHGVGRSLQYGNYEVDPEAGLTARGFVVDGADSVPSIEVQYAKDKKPEARVLRAVRISFENAAGAPVLGIGFRLEAGLATGLDDRSQGPPPYWLGEEIVPPGGAIGSRPIVLDMPPGSYKIVTSRPGYDSTAQEFTVSKETQETVVVVRVE